MRILFVAPRAPFPLLQGDRVRAYHLLRRLSRHHEVTLLTPATRDGARRWAGEIGQICARWIAVPTPWHRLGQEIARRAITPLPIQTAYATARVRREVVAELARGRYDLLHVHLARMGPVADLAGDGTPRVLDFIDSLSLNLRRRASWERLPMRAALLVEAQRMRRYERALAAAFDRQTISSPCDAAWIGGGERLHLVPNGVDLAEFPYGEQGRDDRLIVFSGRVGYFPNQDAACYFATEVFPLVRRQVPDARFVIVGADPPARVRRLAALPGIEVTGAVPRVQEYLGRAAVAVAPLRAGTGVQFKVLEAMASGAPVVATPPVLESLAARDGEHLLIGGSSEALASHVAMLLRQPPLRRAVARRARDLVEARYTWERAARLLEGVYTLARAGRAAAISGQETMR